MDVAYRARPIRKLGYEFDRRSGPPAAMRYGRRIAVRLLTDAEQQFHVRLERVPVDLDSVEGTVLDLHDQPGPVDLDMQLIGKRGRAGRERLVLESVHDADHRFGFSRLRLLDRISPLLDQAVAQD